MLASLPALLALAELTILLWLRVAFAGLAALVAVAVLVVLMGDE